MRHKVRGKVRRRDVLIVGSIILFLVAFLVATALPLEKYAPDDLVCTVTSFCRDPAPMPTVE